MARKKAVNGATTAADGSSSDTAVTPSAAVVVDEPTSQDEVKVNNANATELKLACDDALRKYLSRPDQFRIRHTHTDIRLALGWASVFVAAGTGFYGWKIDFEEAKPVVWVGLILYLFLTSIQTLYGYFVEGDVVFVGKRKTFSKRIETERLTVASRTVPAPAPTPKRSSSPSFYPTPTYSLNLTYLHTTSSGKSLIRKSKHLEEGQYGDWFDSEGHMNEALFCSWVGNAVSRVMGDTK